MNNNPSQTLLTIAIPSYNRPSHAANRLREIKEEMTRHPHEIRKEEVEVIVFENGSSSLYEQLLSEYLGLNIKHSPSKQNNGLYWNFLRCIESTDSEWLWILGDDDEITEGSLRKIIQNIKNNCCEAVIYNNFSKGVGNQFYVSTIKDLFTVTTFSEILFISGLVWKSTLIKSHISTFVEYSFTMSPHVCILLSVLEQNKGQLLVVDESLLNHQKSGELSWSTLDYMRRSLLSVRCLTDKANQRYTAEAQWVNFNWALQTSYSNCKTKHDLDEWRTALKSALADYSEYMPVRAFSLRCIRSSSAHLIKRSINQLPWRKRGTTCTWQAALFLPSWINVEMKK